MTHEIAKDNWKGFFDGLSREKFQWQTRIEILKDEIGAQILSENLPLMGVTFEEKANGETAIEIMLGAEEAEAAHQTHTIFNPTKIVFLETDRTAGIALEIEEAKQAKTLLEIIPFGSLEVIYSEVGIMTAGS